LNLPRIADASFDARMLVFLLAILACVAVVLTIAGAQRLADADPARALAGAGRAAGSRRATRVRGALVVAQFAFALVLVTGAGLLLRSTARLLAVNPGFSSERVLTFRIVLPAARYPELAHRAAFFNEVVSRLRQSPGVEVASSAGYAPMSGSYSSRRFAIIGRPLPPPGQEPFATDSPVGPDYFRVMGIPLIAGRPITERDHSQAPPVVVVSESFARTHFSDASAVGQRIRFYSGRAGAEPPAPREIVGVVGDVRQRAVAEAPLPQLYVPHGQMPWGFGSFVVRVEPGRDPQSIAAGAKRAVAQVDPEQAAYDFRAVDDLVSDGSARHRALAALLTGLALVALTLAAIGIHGVISTSVRQRTREIAVRVALGAGEREVVGAIVKEGLILAVIGAAAGLAGAMALTQLLRALLFEVAPGDPLTFGAGIALLIAVALAASAWPARRALRLDPATALRSE
jgi:putative ABC transport system permease protein